MPYKLRNYTMVVIANAYNLLLYSFVMVLQHNHNYYKTSQFLIDHSQLLLKCKLAVCFYDRYYVLCLIVSNNELYLW